MEKINKLICVNVPVKTCNLRCKYCYITQLKQWGEKLPTFDYDVDHIVKAFDKNRFGGTCLINFTGGGETLLPEEMVSIIRGVLENGHYVEVVTNGTVTKRFEQIAEFPEDILKRLEFKFSFHYLEFKRLNILDKFVGNVNLMRNKGCSFTIECTPTDELMQYAEEMKQFCLDNFGALCHLTIARTDTKSNKEILTDLSEDEYCRFWESFNSEMFNFKKDILKVKRNEFCYAGAWSLYVNLKNGDAQRCYGQPITQNIFADLNKPIEFKPVGHYCRQPYCYNGHAFLTLGVIPELDTPTYLDIRNRKCLDGSEWFNESGKSFYSSKLEDSNKKCSKFKRLTNTLTMPFSMLPKIWRNKDKIISKVLKRNEK